VAHEESGVVATSGSAWRGKLAVVHRTCTPRRADTLPAQYSDEEFWRIVNDFPSRAAAFSMKISFRTKSRTWMCVPDLTRIVKPGGAYLGVAPEQNFHVRRGVKPKVAFILGYPAAEPD
jgi:hypothetical protein